MFVLYDRLSNRYVGASGSFTKDRSEAVGLDEIVAAIRRVSRLACEPVSLVAVRAEFGGEAVPGVRVHA